MRDTRRVRKSRAEQRTHLRSGRGGRKAFNRTKAKNPTHKRCPRCKKLRMWFMRPNNWHDERVMPKRIEPGKSKVCHICQKQAAQIGES